jgi:uncharacterized membrane protein (DUF4010 family)
MSPSELENARVLGYLGVALAIGLMIGLERGWERRELAEGQRAGGVRTFGIISLLGGLAAEIGMPWILVAAGAAIGVFAALGYWRESDSKEDVSLTSAVAAMVTYCLGVMAGRGQLAVAASVAVIVALLLSFKPELHRIVRRIERSELHATFRLLLISVVLLPVLPDRDFGPWRALNPYHLWWLVVLVAAISYVGYFAIKLLGEKRGVLVTGLFGGMVSSTAVTLNLSRGAGDEPRTLDLLTAGIAIASATMFPRIAVLVVAIAPSLSLRLGWPLLGACLGSLFAAGWFARHGESEGLPEGHVHRDPGNPLDLRMALEFGFVLAMIMVLSRAAIVLMGDNGLYIFAAISGLVDVDAISLSLASMTARGETALRVAMNAILIAAAVNTILKPALALAIGGMRIGWRVWIAAALTFIAGGVGLVFAA